MRNSYCGAIVGFSNAASQPRMGMPPITQRSPNRRQNWPGESRRNSDRVPSIHAAPDKADSWPGCFGKRLEVKTQCLRRPFRAGRCSILFGKTSAQLRSLKRMAAIRHNSFCVIDPWDSEVSGKLSRTAISKLERGSPIVENRNVSRWCARGSVRNRPQKKIAQQCPNGPSLPG
jgi:hypothetical protein